MGETIALIGGTGKLGAALGVRLAAAGATVVIGSRERQRAVDVAAQLAERLRAAGIDAGGSLTGMDNATAAEVAEVVVVTVPYGGQAGTLAGLAAAVAGKLVVSTAVPVEFVENVGPVHVEVAAGSAAQEVAALLPGALVVGALQTIGSARLARLGADLDADIIVTGDSEDAKARAARLLALLPGVRVVDGGPLRNCRYVEQVTVLLLSINLRARRSTGIRVTNLPDTATLAVSVATEAAT